MPKKRLGGLSIWSWVIVGFVFVAQQGNGWVYNIPGMIQTELGFWFGGPYYYSNESNALLYSVYNYPNIILLVISGWLMQNWLGFAFSDMIWTGLILLAQVVFALGIDGHTYWLLLFGRTIMGLGGETEKLAANLLCTLYFDVNGGHHLSLAFGINDAAQKLPVFLSFLITPALPMRMAVWLGALVCLLSFGAALAIYTVDQKTREWWPDDISVRRDTSQPFKWSDLTRFPPVAWLVIVGLGWQLTGCTVFVSTCSQIMQHTGQHYPEKEASQLTSSINLVAAVGGPLIGLIIDRVGCLAFFSLAAVACQLVAQLGFLGNAMGWWLINPIPLLVLIGLSQSLTNVVFGSTGAKYYPQQAVALGFALGSSGLAIFKAVVPQIIAAILDSSLAAHRHGTYGYSLSVLLFCFISLVALGINIAIIFQDSKMLRIWSTSKFRQNASSGIPYPHKSSVSSSSLSFLSSSLSPSDYHLNPL